MVTRIVQGAVASGAQLVFERFSIIPDSVLPVLVHMATSVRRALERNADDLMLGSKSISISSHVHFLGVGGSRPAALPDLVKSAFRPVACFAPDPEHVAAGRLRYFGVAVPLAGILASLLTDMAETAQALAGQGTSRARMLAAIVRMTKLFHQRRPVDNAEALKALMGRQRHSLLLVLDALFPNVGAEKLATALHACVIEEGERRFDAYESDRCSKASQQQSEPAEDEGLLAMPSHDADRYTPLDRSLYAGMHIEGSDNNRAGRGRQSSLEQSPSRPVPRAPLGPSAATTATKQCLERHGLPSTEANLARLQQLDVLMSLHHSVLLVGPPGAGKTSLVLALAEVVSSNRRRALKVECHSVFVNSLPLPQLLGSLDASGIWQDGLLPGVLTHISRKVTSNATGAADEDGDHEASTEAVTEGLTLLAQSLPEHGGPLEEADERGKSLEQWLCLDGEPGEEEMKDEAGHVHAEQGVEDSNRRAPQRGWLEPVVELLSASRSVSLPSGTRMSIPPQTKVILESVGMMHASPALAATTPILHVAADDDDLPPRFQALLNRCLMHTLPKLRTAVGKGAAVAERRRSSIAKHMNGEAERRNSESIPRAATPSVGARRPTQRSSLFGPIFGLGDGVNGEGIDITPERLGLFVAQVCALSTELATPLFSIVKQWQRGSLRSQGGAVDSDGMGPKSRNGRWRRSSAGQTVAPRRASMVRRLSATEMASRIASAGKRSPLAAPFSPADVARLLRTMAELQSVMILELVHHGTIEMDAPANVVRTIFARVLVVSAAWALDAAIGATPSSKNQVVVQRALRIAVDAMALPGVDLELLLGEEDAGYDSDNVNSLLDVYVEPTTGVLKLLTADISPFKTVDNQYWPLVPTRPVRRVLAMTQLCVKAGRHVIVAGTIGSGRSTVLRAAEAYVDRPLLHASALGDDTGRKSDIIGRAYLRATEAPVSPWWLHSQLERYCATDSKNVMRPRAPHKNLVCFVDDLTADAGRGSLATASLRQLLVDGTVYTPSKVTRRVAGVRLMASVGFTSQPQEQRQLSIQRVLHQAVVVRTIPPQEEEVETVVKTVLSSPVFQRVPSLRAHGGALVASVAAVVAECFARMQNLGGRNPADDASRLSVGLTLHDMSSVLHGLLCVSGQNGRPGGQQREREKERGKETEDPSQRRANCHRDQDIHPS